ncbi:MAG TPA: YicC family protein [Clostridiaceae bacterium]|jgi:TIGR00255 family protein|nr:yicC domain protein [Clostridium sp. CAG:452]HJJ03969.1 YicC family protein [Clostridiaceae bacterium]
MIKSMTGFGRSTYENEGREYIIEIKSVNNRFTDINIKMPRNLNYLEEKIRKQILSNISRGKVEVSIQLNNNSDLGKKINLNTDIAKKYVEELKKLSEETNIIDNINIMDVARFPDVLNIRIDEEAEEVIEKELFTALDSAIDSFLDMRQKEGSKIKVDLENRIEVIKQKIEQISSISAGLVDEYVVKLETRIKELLKTDVVDQTRLAQEVVIYSDKCSVEEEITRLKSHISQFLNLLNENIAIGKKLDFLIQEMNRETNTIGSKANNLEITNFVVDIKTELENIREQIQNIE